MGGFIEGVRRNTNTIVRSLSPIFVCCVFFTALEMSFFIFFMSLCPYPNENPNWQGVCVGVVIRVCVSAAYLFMRRILRQGVGKSIPGGSSSSPLWRSVNQTEAISSSIEPLKSTWDTACTEENKKDEMPNLTVVSLLSNFKDFLMSSITLPFV